MNWMRTSLGTPTRGGALVTTLRSQQMARRRSLSSASSPRRSSGTAWSTSSKRIVPVAEKAKVQLADAPGRPAALADPRHRAHPDEPGRIPAR